MKYFVIAISIVICILLLLSTRFTYYIIKSDSMVDVINMNDTVIVDKTYNINKLKEGDIICFNLVNYSITVTHFFYKKDGNKLITYHLEEGMVVYDDFQVELNQFKGKVTSILKTSDKLMFGSLKITLILYFISIIAIIYICKMVFLKKRLSNVG